MQAPDLGHCGWMQSPIGTSWQFIAAVWNRVAEGHFSLIAAGVAFYAMFAVFPGLTATIAIWSMVADPGVIGDYLAVAERFLPQIGRAHV